MNAPESVTIGSHRYTIDASKSTARLLRDEEVRADSRPDQLLVRLDPDRPHTAVAETLLHELLHCAWNLTTLRVTEEIQGHEEEVVTALAPWLLDMIRRNPALLAYFTEDE